MACPMKSMVFFSNPNEEYTSCIVLLSVKLFHVLGSFLSNSSTQDRKLATFFFSNIPIKSETRRPLNTLVFIFRAGLFIIRHTFKTCTKVQTFPALFLLTRRERLQSPLFLRLKKRKVFKIINRGPVGVFFKSSLL